MPIRHGKRFVLNTRPRSVHMLRHERTYSRSRAAISPEPGVHILPQPPRCRCILHQYHPGRIVRIPGTGINIGNKSLAPYDTQVCAGHPVAIIIALAAPYSRPGSALYQSARHLAEHAALSHADILATGIVQQHAQLIFRHLSVNNFLHHAPLQLDIPGNIIITAEELERIEFMIFHILLYYGQGQIYRFS